MTAKERVFHAVLFECGAIAVSLLILKLFGTKNMNAALGVSILMAFMAMAWNVVFNWVFDKVFTGERLHRGIGVRLLHVGLFEGGLLLFTVPVIACVLKVSLWQAFLMDIGLASAITVYAFIYNWGYDWVRYHYFVNKTSSN